MLLVTIAVGGILAFLLVIIGLVSSALNVIYATAVYHHAAVSENGAFFDAGNIQNTFRVKG